MEEYYKKLRLILPRFLMVSISSIIGLLVVHVLVDTFVSISLFTDEVWEFYLPIISTLIPLLIWLYPRLKLLRYKEKFIRKGSGATFIITILFIASAIPSGLVQNYFRATSVRIKRVSSVSDINTTIPSRFYITDTCSLSTSKPSVYSRSYQKDKKQTAVVINLYFVRELCSNPTDSSKNSNSYWLGKEYSITLSNEISNERKQELYSTFYSESSTDFYNIAIKDIKCFERVNNSTLDYYQKAIILSNTYYTTQELIVFKPCYELPNLQSNTNLAWIFLTYGIGLVYILFQLIFPKVKSEKEVQDEALKFTSFKKNTQKFLNLFIPKDSHTVTALILDINILIFIVMIFSGVDVFSPTYRDLISWGANFKPLVIQGEWWRLGTCMFIHAGILHVVANIIGLLIVSELIEPHFSFSQQLLLYICSGVIAAGFSLYWYDNAVCVGASGAIFGYYGAVISLAFTKAYPKAERKKLLQSMLLFIGLNILYGLNGEVDNAAHLGGLASGIVLGGIIYELHIKNKQLSDLS